MSVDEFASHFQWLTDEKTIKALEKMKTRELKAKAKKIAEEAIEAIKKERK